VIPEGYGAGPVMLWTRARGARVRRRRKGAGEGRPQIQTGRP
jgi:hypothetical protein